MSAKKAATISSYSARRVLPSVEGEAGLTTQEKAALSNWTDVSADAGGAAAAVASSMAAHYDEMKLQQSAVAKSMTITAIATAVETAASGFQC